MAMGHELRDEKRRPLCHPYYKGLGPVLFSTGAGLPCSSVPRQEHNQKFPSTLLFPFMTFNNLAWLPRNFSPRFNGIWYSMTLLGRFLKFNS